MRLTTEYSPQTQAWRATFDYTDRELMCAPFDEVDRAMLREKTNQHPISDQLMCLQVIAWRIEQLEQGQ